VFQLQVPKDAWAKGHQHISMPKLYSTKILLQKDSNSSKGIFLNYTMAPGHKSTSCALGCLHQNILQSDPVRHDHIRMGSKFQSDIDLVNKKHMPEPEPFAIEVCKTRL
jgi:hypothetical protein